MRNPRQARLLGGRDTKFPSCQTIAFLAGYRENASLADDRTDFDILRAADMRIARLSKFCTTLTSEKRSLVMINAKLNRTIQSCKKYGSTPLKLWYPNMIRQSKKREIDVESMLTRPLRNFERFALSIVRLNLSSELSATYEMGSISRDFHQEISIPGSSRRLFEN
jgi:hypothetical protein